MAHNGPQRAPYSALSQQRIFAAEWRQLHGEGQARLRRRKRHGGWTAAGAAQRVNSNHPRRSSALPASAGHCAAIQPAPSPNHTIGGKRARLRTALQRTPFDCAGEMDWRDKSDQAVGLVHRSLWRRDHHFAIAQGHPQHNVFTVGDGGGALCFLVHRAARKPAGAPACSHITIITGSGVKLRPPAPHPDTTLHKRAMASMIISRAGFISGHHLGPTALGLENRFNNFGNRTFTGRSGDPIGPPKDGEVGIGWADEQTNAPISGKSG